ncbi:MAG TPA: hypothetical protein DCR93_37025 [Cytophagales bacterium]|nr:hypothetical protein [Cytophagales bacterium]HAP64858.1 hypothetical protein [Cytophagales bacterium]
MVGCQPNAVEEEILAMEPAPVQGMAKGSSATEGITVENGMLSFDSEATYASTIEALVVAENDQATGGAVESFPSLADFESQFAGFTSQRAVIQDAYFGGDYDLETLPDASAVKSPAIQATLNADGQVKVAGQVFTVSDEGITSEETGTVVENNRNGEACCITWKSDQTVYAHSSNQYMIGRGYIYSFTFFGVQYIFVKGTEAINLRFNLFFTPWNMEKIRAQPWSGWFARGGCGGTRTHYNLGLQENEDHYQATESFVRISLLPQNRMFGIDNQIHLVQGQQKSTFASWIINCMD